MLPSSVSWRSSSARLRREMTAMCSRKSMPCCLPTKSLRWGEEPLEVISSRREQFCLNGIWQFVPMLETSERRDRPVAWLTSACQGRGNRAWFQNGEAVRPGGAGAAARANGSPGTSGNQDPRPLGRSGGDPLLAASEHRRDRLRQRHQVRRHHLAGRRSRYQQGREARRVRDALDPGDRDQPKGRPRCSWIRDAWSTARRPWSRGD